MNRIDLTNLVASFPRIARVGLVRSSVHDFLGLNTEPMNRAIEGSHLYLAEQAKKAKQNTLWGQKKYRQQNGRIETWRQFYVPLCSFIISQYSICAGTKTARKHRPIVISERFVENECAGWCIKYPSFGPFWDPIIFFCSSVEVVACWGSARN